MIPKDCPKFIICEAAICPLDPVWRSAVHLSGEPICFYLRGSAKDGADEYFEGDLIFPIVKARSAEVCAKHPDIARGLAKAATSGFQGQHLRRGKTPFPGG
jgi:hypothetical protein